ncbi:MAG TPA: flagellin N-methylase, partial [Paraburkholderia sp.]|nr:flagellin N-methylase [Paraburkholderia sp.]
MGQRTGRGLALRRRRAFHPHALPGFGAAAVVGGSWSLACNACGKCCNSPPALSLREWFAHRAVFVGSLAIERVARRRVGERLVAGGADRVERVLDAQDIDAQ